MMSAPTRTIRIAIEYDGTGLFGWQAQKTLPSVQGHLEAALSRIAKHQVAIIGASRTDAGVHAIGQVAKFLTSTSIPAKGLMRGANAFLPEQIAIVSSEACDASFHPRFDARGKTYRYAVSLRSAPSPLIRNRAWQREPGVDVAAMRKAADCLVGEHDFSAFRSAGCGARHAVRRVTALDIEATDSEITFQIEGNAFLRHMVRIIVGSLMQIGEGLRDVSSVEEALRSKDRRRAGITAPPQGLTLVKVHYESDRQSS